MTIQRFGMRLVIFWLLVLCMTEIHSCSGQVAPPQPWYPTPMLWNPPLRSPSRSSTLLTPLTLLQIPQLPSMNETLSRTVPFIMSHEQQINELKRMANSNWCSIWAAFASVLAVKWHWISIFGALPKAMAWSLDSMNDYARRHSGQIPNQLSHIPTTPTNPSEGMLPRHNRPIVVLGKLEAPKDSVSSALAKANPFAAAMGGVQSDALQKEMVKESVMALLSE